MTWRYQPVITENQISLCEVYLNGDSTLHMHTASPHISPSGETVEELNNDLLYMIECVKRWRPVEFDKMKTGMKFEEI